jgi:hypothetical protein
VGQQPERVTSVGHGLALVFQSEEGKLRVLGVEVGGSHGEADAEYLWSGI